MSARGAFQKFLTALAAHNAGGGSVHEVSVAVSELIEALPYKAAGAPVRARLAMITGNAKIRAALGSPSYTPTRQGQNLILGLTNLLEALGGGNVPARYRNF